MVKVIDTPGFLDTTGSDFKTLEAIMTLLEEIKDKGFHLALFCFQATNMRCDKGI